MMSVRRLARLFLSIGLPLLYAIAVLLTTGQQKPRRVRAGPSGVTVAENAGPVALHRTDPIYPPQARRERVEGIVKLRVRISPDGRVSEVVPLSGPPLLVPAAVQAVKQWLFEPGEAATEVWLPFTLN